MSSLTQAQFNGGAVNYTSGNRTFDRNTPRVVRYSGDSDVIWTLPAGGIYRKDEEGGPYWYIIAAGEGSITVNQPSGSLLVTIAPGQMARITLKNAAAGIWAAKLLTIGTARTFGRGARAAVVAAEEDPVFDPDCFEGDDCARLREDGLLPLDGQEGRPLVKAWMFCDPTAPLSETRPETGFWREPIRGADIIMPNKVAIRIAPNEFEVDHNHPMAALYPLSSKLFEILYNNGRPHVLTYKNAHHHGGSRHWHHMRYEGASPTPGYFWTMPDGTGPEVKRHVWEKIIEYRYGESNLPPPFPPDLPTRLILRFVMETAEDEDGLRSHPTEGALGSVFHVFAFTEEVAPNLGENMTYVPVGATDEVLHDYEDCCSCGASEGMPVDRKFCHPRLLFAGTLPTTMENPIGRNYVPPEDRKWQKDFQRPWVGDRRGRNREYCYVVNNGMPWTTVNTAPNATSTENGIWGNVVFGTLNPGTMACFTRGGDVPRSTLIRYVCLENGAGVGRTLLKPARAGWDEARGQLTIEEGSSVSITICGIDDEDWPREDLSPCEGHPAEKLEGFGGTHRCFFNGLHTDLSCCHSLDTHLMRQQWYCLLHYGRFDEFCTPVNPAGCAPSSDGWTQFSMIQDDYYYALGTGSYAGRTATWYRFLPDPDWVYHTYRYTLDNADNANLAVLGGTFNRLIDGIEITAIEGFGDIRALQLYAKTPTNQTFGVAPDWRDGTVKVRLYNARTKNYLIVTRWQNNSRTQGEGFAVEINPTDDVGGADIILLRYDWDGVTQNRVVLKTVHTTTLPDTVDVEVDQWGTQLEAIISGVDEEIRVDDCHHYIAPEPGTAMYFGWGTRSTTTTGHKFGKYGGGDGGPEVAEKTYQYVQATAIVTPNAISMTCDLEMSHWYYPGVCSGSLTPDCTGIPPYGCNCIQKTLVRSFVTFSAWNADAPTTNPAFLGGPNQPAEDCQDNWCANGRETCSDCPQPYIALSLILNGCPGVAEPQVAGYCDGLDHWVWSPIFCE